MSNFGDDLIQSLNEAVSHAKGEGPAIIHEPVDAKDIRERAMLTQAQIAPMLGMSVSGYRKWEQDRRRISGPGAILLRVLDKEPEAFKRAISSQHNSS